MNNTSKSIAVIDNKASNYYITYLVTNFLNGLMGEGEITNAAINDILADSETYKKIHDIITPIDAAFIRKMVAILGDNSDFVETMRSFQKSGEGTGKHGTLKT